MSTEVVVTGVGMTTFARHLDRGLRSLTTEAVSAALADADASAEEVQATFFANASAGIITGQESIRGQAALRETGLLGPPIYNIENACASSSSAFALAWHSIASGANDIVVVAAAEKLAHPDKQRSFRALAGAVDLEWAREVSSAGGGGATTETKQEQQPDEGGSSSHSTFMDEYADIARAYMEHSGATPTDFARVVVKSRRFASMNPRAQFREPTSIEEVLEAREIVWPLTLPMCSPIGDGSAALVLMSKARADRHDVPGIRVRASIIQSGSLAGPFSLERAAQAAYDQAGLGPAEIDVVELHDAAAPAELKNSELLGLCGVGDGPAFAAKGETDLGGRVPINTGGGLLSRGHPIGATGCAQLVELVEQLRGRAGARQVDGARIGLAQNAGGTIGPDTAVAAVTILGG